MGQNHKKADLVATFSIVAYDPKEKAWGVAVQSKFLGVGAVVPYAKAGVGAVATQSLANPEYGPKGLQLMAEGQSSEATLLQLTQADADSGMRQAGLVDAEGRPATFTGNDCYDWAGGITGDHYAAQGNILVNKETVQAMGQAYEESIETLPFAERLIKALDAAQSAGGDSRGKQSAALLVVKDKGGYGGLTDRAVDLRVDDHQEPIKELQRIYNLHQLYFSKPNPEDIVAMDEPLKQDIIENLERVGYLKNGQKPHTDVAFYDAVRAFFHTENFEEREQSDGKIDLAVVRYLRDMKTPIRN